MLVLPHSAQPVSHRGLLPATPQPTAAPSGSQTWSCDCAAFHEYFLAVSSSSSAFVTYKGKKKKKSFAFQALPLVQPMSSFPRLQHAFGLLQSLRDCSHPWGIAPVVRAKLHKLKDVMGLC